MTACRFGLREIEGRRPHGQKVNTHALFVDWAGVVRKLGAEVRHAPKEQWSIPGTK